MFQYTDVIIDKVVVVGFFPCRSACETLSFAQSCWFLLMQLLLSCCICKFRICSCWAFLLVSFSICILMLFLLIFLFYEAYELNWFWTFIPPKCCCCLLSVLAKSWFRMVMRWKWPLICKKLIGVNIVLWRFHGEFMMTFITHHHLHIYRQTYTQCNLIQVDSQTQTHKPTDVTSRPLMVT